MSQRRLARSVSRPHEGGHIMHAAICSTILRYLPCLTPPGWRSGCSCVSALPVAASAADLTS